MSALDASNGATHSVEVSYTIADHYAAVFAAGHLYLLKIVAPLAILAVIFIGLGVVLSGESLREALAWFPWELWGGLAIVLGAFNFGIVPVLAWWGWRRRQSGQPLTITVEEDGVRVRSKSGASLIYWTAIKRIRATEARLLLFVGLGSAIIVPARAMPDDCSFQSVVDIAFARWREARKRPN